jgi:hypothetical protein
MKTIFALALAIVVTIVTLSASVYEIQHATHKATYTV